MNNEQIHEQSCHFTPTPPVGSFRIKKFVITLNSIVYKIQVSLLDISISIRLTRQMDIYYYEGIFKLEDFQNINRLFGVCNNLQEIYKILINKIEKYEISIEEKFDYLNMMFYFSLDSNKESITITLPQNQIIDYKILLKEMRSTILNLSERIKVLESKVKDKSIESSKIITQKDEIYLIKNWINAEAKNISFQLLYRSSSHGNMAYDFHRKCDNKGATISFIKTRENLIFGGFTSLNWDTSFNYGKHDPYAFIFSLNLKEKYKISDADHVILCDPHLLCTYGQGYDICVRDRFTSCYVNFPTSYGVEENPKNCINGGKCYFSVVELEVYLVSNYVTHTPCPLTS
jgi:hypothetical protein